MPPSKNSKYVFASIATALFVFLLFAILIVLLVRNRDASSKVLDTAQYNISDSSTISQTSIPDTRTTTGDSTTRTTERSQQESSTSDSRTTQIYLPTISPIEEITVPTRSLHVPHCDIPSTYESTCPSIKRLPTTNGDQNGLIHAFDHIHQSSVQLSDTFRPVEYALNLSITDKNQNILGGSLDLLAEIVLKETNTIALHAGGHVQFPDDAKFTLWECANGRLICVNSITRLTDKNLVVISLSESLKPGTAIRLRIDKFESEIVGNPGLVVQMPSKWEKDRAWIVGTHNNHANTSRFVFPGVDEPQVVAALKLCLQHPKDAFARSNMPTQSSTDSSDGHATTTCFHESPNIPAQLFAFVLFDNLKQINAISNTSHAANEKTAIESFVGKHLHNEDCQWILDEAARTLNKMSSLTSVHYPLEKLTILSTPIPTDGTRALGLIQLKESWIEYPKYFFPHSLLVSQVVQQWVSNMITICDKCIQEGLASYLEWTVTSAESISDTQSNNISRRFHETRNRLLHSESAVRTNMASLSINSLKPTTNRCADRTALVFYMLEQAYGQQAIANFLTVLFRKFSWGRCITADELSLAFRSVVNADGVFESFLDQSQEMVDDYPVIHVNFVNSSLVVSQDSASSNKTYVIPVEVVDDARKISKVLLNDTQIAVHRPAAYVVAQPNTYARHIYNVENYAKLVDCVGDRGEDRCPSISRDSLANTFNDLCWALLHNRLNEVDKAAQWRAVFERLVAQGNVVQGDCACCMEKKGAAKAQCRWTWRDKCSQISLLKAL
ncbi:matrix non-peptidase like protein 1 [Ditylenchus destructor]|nr:matrix non-peptidase like protein 1 [Ditylenchus destructor]